MKKISVLLLIAILLFSQISMPTYANELEKMPANLEDKEETKNILDDTKVGENKKMPKEKEENPKETEENKEVSEEETQDSPNNIEVSNENLTEELEGIKEKYNILKEENIRLRKEILKLYNKLNKTPADKIPVLMYHHLLKQSDIDKYGWKNNNSVLSVEAFEKQMEYLYKNGFYTATLDELQDFIDGKINLPKKTVVITFDDGYYSNAIYAHPIMKKYNFRGTIFMLGYRIEGPQAEFDPKSLQSLSIAESYKYSDVFDYESHTYALHKKDKNNKPLLLVSGKDIIIEDLNKNREILNSKYFAYPYGAYNNDTIKYLKETSHKMAFTTKNGYVVKNMDKFKLPRFGINPKVSMNKFVSIVSVK